METDEMNTDEMKTDDRQEPASEADRIGTHWEGCWRDGGRRHWQCAVGEAQAQRARAEAAEAALATSGERGWYVEYQQTLAASRVQGQELEQLRKSVEAEREVFYALFVLEAFSHAHDFNGRAPTMTELRAGAHLLARRHRNSGR